MEFYFLLIFDHFLLFLVVFALDDLKDLVISLFLGHFPDFFQAFVVILLFFDL